MCVFMALKVIPIYGRGGDNTDPRQKAQSLGNKEKDKDGPVPRRPAGQRIAPVLVSIRNLHFLQQQKFIFLLHGYRLTSIQLLGM